MINEEQIKDKIGGSITMTTELEEECRKWFYERVFVPSLPSLDEKPYGYDMNYIKSLREIVEKYIKEDFDIVKGAYCFGIEIRTKFTTIVLHLD